MGENVNESVLMLYRALFMRTCFPSRNRRRRQMLLKYKQLELFLKEREIILGEKKPNQTLKRDVEVNRIEFNLILSVNLIYF